MELNYSFPYIEHIDDIWPYLKDNKAFIKVEKPEGYTVINYVLMGDEAFEPFLATDTKEQHLVKTLQREARGIKFDTATGEIISRPYHKFFNQGERLVHLDSLKEQQIVNLEKLDGSMVSPVVLPDGSIRLMTKMGITDTSLIAESMLQDFFPCVLGVFFNRSWLQFYTPIFEFCSNENQIVLSYPEPRLVLTAVRTNKTGNYLEYPFLKQYGVYGIDVVSEVNPRFYLNREGVEGLVQRNSVTGHMLKLKTEWYLTLHRAKDSLTKSQTVDEMIITDKMDDFISTCPDVFKEPLDNYWVEFDLNLVRVKARIEELIERISSWGMTRKEFALDPRYLEPKGFRNLVFTLWDCPKEKLNETLWSELKKYLTKAVLGSNYKEIREDLFGKDFKEWKLPEVK